MANYGNFKQTGVVCEIAMLYAKIILEQMEFGYNLPQRTETFENL